MQAQNSWKIYFVGAALLLLSGCTKCSEEKQPHADPTTANKEHKPTPEEIEAGDNAMSADEEALEHKIETDRAMRKQDQESRIRNVPMDNPGPAKPNEDRD